MTRKIALTILTLLMLSVTLSAEQPFNESRYDDLPKGIYTTLVGSGFFDTYEVYFNMSPFFQRGDFNGDGAFDIAIQVVSKTSRKRGIAFLHANDLNYRVIGAGKDFGTLGDDFSWLKKWRIDSYTLPQSRISATAEALILDNPEFPKSLVYFDGGRYQTMGLDAYSYYSDGPAYSQVLPAL